MWSDDGRPVARRRRPDQGDRDPGHRRRDGGEPVDGAYVRLLDATGEFTAEVPTSATGQFRFFAAPGDLDAAHARAEGRAGRPQGRRDAGPGRRPRDRPRRLIRTAHDRIATKAPTRRLRAGPVRLRGSLGPPRAEASSRWPRSARSVSRRSSTPVTSTRRSSARERARSPRRRRRLAAVDRLPGIKLDLDAQLALLEQMLPLRGPAVVGAAPTASTATTTRTATTSTRTRSSTRCCCGTCVRAG